VADFPLFCVGRVWVRALDRFENHPDSAYNRKQDFHLIGHHYGEAD
jgi:hypothetical protein